MTTRREASKARRSTFHLRKVNAAETDRARVRKAFMWAIAEAVRTGQLIDLLRIAVDLVYRIQEQIPLPEPAAGSPAHQMHDVLDEGNLVQDRALTSRRDVE